jgi:hypothetical protein
MLAQLRSYPDIYLEGLRRCPKTSVRSASVLAQIHEEHRALPLHHNLAITTNPGRF